MDRVLEYDSSGSKKEVDEMLTPTEWSVVVAGFWNRAILTPQGIGKRLFQLADQTPIEILVPIDAFAPFKVRIEGLEVTAMSDRLTIAPLEQTYSSLDQARRIASIALERLPETPVSAAGVNLKFKILEAPIEFIRLFDSGMDASLAGIDLAVRGREFRRSVEWHGGLINITAKHPDVDSFLVHFNFEKTTAVHADLRAWLDIPIVDLQQISDRILADVFHLQMEVAGA